MVTWHTPTARSEWSTMTDRGGTTFAILICIFVIFYKGELKPKSVGPVIWYFCSSWWRMLFPCWSSRRIRHSVYDWFRDSLHLRHYCIQFNTRLVQEQILNYSIIGSRSYIKCLLSRLGKLLQPAGSPETAPHTARCDGQWRFLLQMCPAAGKTRVSQTVGCWF